MSRVPTCLRSQAVMTHEQTLNVRACTCMLHARTHFETSRSLHLSRKRYQVAEEYICLLALACVSSHHFGVCGLCSPRSRTLPTWRDTWSFSRQSGPVNLAGLRRCTCARL